MGKSDSQRYYWLKMPLDFFDSDKIKLLKGYPNGSEYVIFYLRLLLMAANREGKLRLDDEIPYDPETLAILTDTNVDVVKGAIAALERLRMLDILDDHTIYMSEIDKLVGSETKGAERKRIYRGKSDNVRLMADNVPSLSSKCPRDIDREIDIEKDREIDIEKEKGISTGVDIPKEKDELSLIPTPESKPKKERKRFIPPTVEEVAAYCRERGNNVDAEAFVAHYSARNWIPKGYTKQMTNWKAAVITWEKYDQKRAQEQRHNNRVVGGNEFTALKEQEGYTGSNIFGG